MNKIQSCISLIDKALDAYLVPEEEVTEMVLKPSKDFPTDGPLTERDHIRYLLREMAAIKKILES
jgi:hypothetical protein